MATESRKSEIPYLTEENWPNWRRIVTVTLKSKDLWNIVNDTEHVGAGADAAATAVLQKAFRKRQFEAICIIITPISSSLGHILPTEPEDPVQLWKDLVLYFESQSAFNLLTVNQRLLQPLKDRDDPKQWLVSRKSNFLKLTSLGEPISDKMQCMSTISMLPPSYSTLVTSIGTQIQLGLMDMNKIVELVTNFKKTKSSAEENAFYSQSGASGHSSISSDSSRSRGGRGRSGFSSRGGRSRGGHSRGRGGRGGGSTSSGFSDKECYKCHGVGHVRNQCPNFQNEKEHTVHTVGHLFNATNVANGKNQSIIIDSGASCHMSSDICNFCDITYFDVSQSVTLGDGHVSESIGVGTLYVAADKVRGSSRNLDIPIGFENCLVVPNLSCTLVSVKKLTETDRCTVEFGRDMVTVWLHNEPWISGSVKNGVYVMNGHVLSQSAQGFSSLSDHSKTTVTGDRVSSETSIHVPISASEIPCTVRTKAIVNNGNKSYHHAILDGAPGSRAPGFGEQNNKIIDKNVVSSILAKKTEISDGQFINSDGLLSHNQAILEGAPTVSRAPRFGESISLADKNVVPTISAEKAFAATGVSADIWHRRFGHMGADNMRKIINGNYVNGLVYSDKKLFSFCRPCVEGKTHVLPFPKVSYHRSTCIMDMIHTDIFGPVATPSIGHSKYIVTFIDDYSRFVWVRFLKYKSEVFDVFTELLLLLENSTGHKLKTLRSDQGGEYMSNKFQSYLKKRGIHHQRSTPDAHAQNGVAERMNLTILDKVRCMLSDSRIDKQFWGEAAAAAVYVRNRSPSMSVPVNTTPYELWTGQKPDVRNLRVFGCEAFAHVPKKFRTKIDKKTEKCTFIGYSTHSKAYRLFSHVRQSVIVRRDVIFNEGSMAREGDVEQYEQTVVLDLGDPEPVVVQVPEPVEPIYVEDSEEEDFDDAHDDIAPPEPAIVPEPVVVPPVVVTTRSGRVSKQPNRLGFHMTADIKVPEPRTWKQAMRSSNAEQWKKAAEAEFQSLMKHETWDLVTLPPGKKLVGGRWVFRAKHDENGQIERFKGRYVAQGFTQVHGEDYNEIFSPVVRWESVRTLISMAVQNNMLLHQMDVETAFLNGLLSDEIYMQQPEGFIKPGQEHLVCKLKHSLYGLKQSPRCWNEVLHKQLLNMQFVQSAHDSCIYIGKVNGDLVFLAVYVDDLIIASQKLSVIKKTKTLFAQKFAVKDMGQLHYFLGVRVEQTDSTVWLSQEKYCNNILERYEMSDCYAVATPMETTARPTKAHDHSKMCDQRQYQSAIGSLLYLAGATRPDISYAVHKLAQYCSSPTTEHWNLVKRVLRYVKGTVGLGLLYQRQDNSLLEVYSDSDYAGDMSDRKSTSGYALVKNGAVVSWKSKKQSIVAQSTAEAEYVALYFSAQETFWMRQLLLDLKEKLSEPTVIHEDNQAAIRIVNNPVDHPKTKHIATKFHFIRQQVQDGTVKIVYCPTDLMLADILTKPLARDRFTRLRSCLGLTIKVEKEY